MTRLITLVMLVALSLPASAKQKDFNLNIQRLDNGKETIHYKPTDWEFVTESTTYKVNVEKGALRTDQDSVEFHSVTIFNEPFFYDSVGSLVDKIYTYGILSCKEKTLFVFNEMFVDPKEIIVFNSIHEYGSFVVELESPNTMRNDILKAVCNKSI